MEIDYVYSAWLEEIRPSGEVKVIFNGRGYLKGEGDAVFLFAAPIKPFYMAVHGEWARGVFYENDGTGARKFYVFSHERREGDKVRVRLVLRGVFEKGVLERGVYKAPVEWRGRHKHVITVLGALKVSGVKPPKALVSRGKAGVTMSWLWRKGFKGELRFRFTA